MYNGIWYYSTYLLTWTDPDAPQDMPDWGVLEPWVGFRYSSDKGVTWTNPTDSAVTLLEPHHDAGKGGKEIMIGAPHFVDFGRNMQHAPVDSGTGRKFAYMVAHGADPGIQIAAHNSWIQGDNIYLIRILMPNGTNAAANAAYLNTATNWQYYARNDTWKNWDKNNLAGVYSNIQAIAHWSQRLGNVSMTYNAALGKYMMVMSRVVTGNKDIMDGMVLESDAITGPFRLVQYLPSFGVRAYFLNIPSKFISADGLTMWLSFSANYWWHTPSSFPGAVYGWCLREFKLSTDPNPITDDCLIDLADFDIVSAHWMEAECNGGNNFCSGADIDQMGDVGLSDLFMLAGNWLEGTPHLMARWELDESSGTVASDSVGGHDGTLNGDPMWWPSGGRIGGALEFDGVGDYVEIEGYKGISGSNPRTVTAWIRAESNGSGLSIVRWGTLEINGGLWSNVINAAGKLRAAVWGGSVVGDTTINDDTWHHVAIVLPDKEDVKVEDILLYVDGEPEDTTISLGSQAIDTAVGMDVLISLDGSVGLLDDVRIYNYALSEEDIQALAGVL